METVFKIVNKQSLNTNQNFAIKTLQHDDFINSYEEHMGQKN